MWFTIIYDVEYCVGSSNVTIMDYGGLMCGDCIIELNDQRLKTSSIVFALWRTGNLKNCQTIRHLLSEDVDSKRVGVNCI